MSKESGADTSAGVTELGRCPERLFDRSDSADAAPEPELTWYGEPQHEESDDDGSETERYVSPY